MVYNNIMLSPVLLLILLCVSTFNVRSQTTSIHVHKFADEYDYDITTFYRMSTDIRQEFNGYRNNDGFKDTQFLTKYNGSYTIEIHSRTNAIGLPIQTHNMATNYSLSEQSVTELFTADQSLWSKINQKFVTYFMQNARIRLTGHNCENDDFDYYRGYSSEYNCNRFFNKYHNTYYSCAIYDECYDALEYRYDNYFKVYNSHIDEYHTFFELYWTPNKDQTCLTVSYVHRSNSLINVFLDVSNVSQIPLNTSDSIQTLKLTNMKFKKGEKYELSLNSQIIDGLKYYDHYFGSRYKGIWFGLLRIAECSNDDEEDVRIMVPTSKSVIPKPFTVLDDGSTNTSYAIESCLNGGFMISSKCVCPPGFVGQFCENGCGQNSYGADCQGICSNDDDKMCRGIYMCTKYGCTCPPGLTGPFCDEDCKPGHYGANCQQNCSSSCRNNHCDPYTGICSYGCSPGYMLKYNCKEKYPYLINPPKLFSYNNDSIQVILDLKLNNINGGDGNIKPKYYQLVYKSINEIELKTSDPKPINQNNTDVNEILSDLKPGVTYDVGVILISNDGNTNNENIAYNQCRTSCTQQQISDYNVTITSGLKSVNITWNKIISSNQECKVNKYVLTLISHNSNGQMPFKQEIVSTSESGHIIDDLFPGYLYTIQLTPMTVNGPLQPSPEYDFTVLKKRTAIKIKDIEAKYGNENITVCWKLVDRSNTIVNEPITCVIRYKIQKILSCSLTRHKLDSNWISIKVFNQSCYDIVNIIPNSQYSIQITIDTIDKHINKYQQGNEINVLTPESIPKTEPIIDNEHSINVTNNSVSLHWKINRTDCSHLNGFISNYYIELKDMDDKTIQRKNTKEKHIFFDNLKSNTSYALKIFIQTYVGYNPDHFLLTNFTTKFENIGETEKLTDGKSTITQSPNPVNTPTVSPGITQSPDSVNTSTVHTGITQSPDSVNTPSSQSGTTQSPNSVNTPTVPPGITQSLDSVNTSTVHLGNTQSPDSVNTPSSQSGTTQSPDSVNTPSSQSSTTQSPNSVNTPTVPPGITQSLDSVNTSTVHLGNTQSPDSVNTPSSQSGTTQSPDSVNTPSSQSSTTQSPNSVNTPTVPPGITQSLDSVNTSTVHLGNTQSPDSVNTPSSQSGTTQ